MANIYDKYLDQTSQNPYDKYLQPAQPDQSDVWAGLKTSFKQLPELGWGLASIAAAGIESAVGEGGVATAAKKFAVNKYVDWQQDIAKDSRDVYELDTAWDKAKQGNFGALVDWAQYGIGYAVGQGLQIAGTVGVGKLAAQLALKPAVEKYLAGAVTKKAAELGATEAGAKLSADELNKLAVSQIATKVGEHAALAGTAFGMEGGEIGGDLAASTVGKDGSNRVLSGAELGRAFGATLAAGAMEYGEDLLSWGALKGFPGLKSKKMPFAETPGVGGRVGRAAVGSALTAPIEAGTEYMQTGMEEFGKGTESSFLPWQQSPEAQRQAFNAAGLGAIGGMAHGSFGGLISSAQRKASEDLNKATNASEAVAAANDLANAVDVDLAPAIDAYKGSAQPAESLAQSATVVPPAAASQPTGIAAMRAAVDRQAELANAAVNAGTEFERNQATEQLKTSLGEPKAGLSTQYVDLTPMEPMQAQQRLAVMRDEAAQTGGNALGLEIVPHPAVGGRFAIKANPLPSLDLGPSNIPAATQAEANARLGAAAAQREPALRNELFQPYEAVTDRLQRAIENEGGTTTAPAAAVLDRAQVGVPGHKTGTGITPYDRVTGTSPGRIEVPTALTDKLAEDKRVAALQQSNDEWMATRAERNAANKQQAANELQTQIDQTSQPPTPPAADSVVAALKVEPAQRTAEQSLAVRQAESRYAPADLDILQRAATAPFTLSLEERGRMRELRSPTPVKQENTRTASRPPMLGERATAAITGQAPAAAEVQTQETEPAPSTPFTYSPELQGQKRPQLSQPTGGLIITSNAKLSTPRGINPGATITVKDGDQEHIATVVDPAGLGPSNKLLTQIARIFNKRLVVYKSDTLQADGFVLPDNNNDIHINVKGTVSPLAVFGHELTHMLKREHSDGYAAVERVIKSQMTDEQWAQYQEDYGETATLEELAGDLMGNRFQDAQFWTDVFDDIAREHGEAAGGIIARLGAAMNRVIAQFIKAIGATSSPFKADQILGDTKAVHAALRTALVQYAKQTRNPAVAMEAGVAEQATTVAEKATPFRYSPEQQGQKRENIGVPIVGTDERVLFSPAQRGGNLEQVGDFQVRSHKDGTLAVKGDVDAIRALMPEGVVGRPVPGGVVFTTAQAPRARAALEGRNVAYGRAGQRIERLPMKDGKYIGAPEKFNTPNKIPTLRKWLRKLAREGEPGRFWYENSGREILQMVQGNVQEARRFLALLAIYSPQAKVDANSTFALRAWAQYKMGQPISVKTAVQDDKAQAAMADVDAFWSGEKTGNFYTNLLREVDPSTANRQGATIDMWMMRAAQYPNDAPTATQYAFMEHEVNEIAAEFGWEPQQVQAAIWVAMKARMENEGVKQRTEASSEKKGWLRYDYPIKKGKPRKTRVILDEQSHRDNWLKHAFEHDPSQEDTAQAKFDFSDGVRRHIGQISFEARPGRSTGVLPGIHSAPYKQQLEFQQAVQAAFLDENGNDELAQRLGLLVDNGDFIAPGVWQHEVSPSNQKSIAMAPVKGGEAIWDWKQDKIVTEEEAAAIDPNWKKNGRFEVRQLVDPAQRSALNVYTAASGLVTWQEGVGWHRPFYAGTKAKANGLDIRIGRPLTPQEAISLETSIDAWMKSNNKVGWQDQFAIISSPTGVRLVTFGAVSNTELQKDIVRVAETSLPDANAVLFASDGDMPTNDWKESPNGQDYVDRVSAEGRSDVLGWVRDVLAPRVQAVFDEFSEKYGWGDPGQIRVPEPAGRQETRTEVTDQNATDQGGVLTSRALFSPRRDAEVTLPDALILKPLGLASKHPDYAAAKAGDLEAATRVAASVLDEEAISRIKSALGNIKPTILPVAAKEARGNNMLPVAAAYLLGEKLGLPIADEVIQSVRAGRTGLEGLDRIFTQPEFEGRIEPGKDYLILDDTLTQGGTFAALASHIEENAGRVVLPVALTGKQYSAKLQPDPAVIEVLRQKFGDIEDDFKNATGYGFNALTQSEARYLASYRPADAVRDRILASRYSEDQGSGTEVPREAGPSIGPEKATDENATDQGGVSVSGETKLSRSRIVGDSKREYTPEQKAMFERTGRTVTDQSLKERVASLRQGLGTKLAQGIADQFAPLKAFGERTYRLARLSKGASGAFEALLKHGKLSVDKDGAYDADMSGGFLERIGVPLHGELHDFLWWVAGNRAERLTEEEREHLFRHGDINAAKSLDNGTTKWDYTLRNDVMGRPAGTVTRDRTLIYRDTLIEFAAFNKNVMDAAEKSGLIDKKTRPIWEHDFYVPFYRMSDEKEGFVGAKLKQGLVRQQAFKMLEGGTDKLNSDLVANTLANWAHLIDASAKNRAAKASLEAAVSKDAAIEADETTAREMSKSIHKRDSVVWFMDGGVKRTFVVKDQMTMVALEALQFAGFGGPMMKALSTFKHALTVGVTASPGYKARNLIRDSVQAIALGDLSYNPLTNIKEGFKASDHKSQEYVSALASGGLIRFGTMLEGSESRRVDQLIRAGIKDETILDSPNKFRAVWDRYLDPAISAYNELGNRSEEINRMALYKQLRAKGKSHLDASFLARDLMDFSMQGSWTSIRFLAQVVPFFNSRIQGLYKLGRSAQEDPKRFSVVLGATATASIMLMLAYADDPDWKKREDWDRDNFWWFKLGGVAFRIPKPFEIGAAATLAERGVELWASPEMTGKRFMERMKNILSDQLSMNPVPQLFKPLLDIYANKDSFTGRPIETMGMERLAPDYRFNQGTSMTARAIGTAGQTAASAVGGRFFSPVQIDHAIQGYFGWLGSFIVDIADVAARPLSGQPDRPAPDYFKVVTQNMVAQLEGAPSRYVTHMYDQAKIVEEAYGTWQSLVKTGKPAEAAEYLADNREKIVQYKTVESLKRAAALLNEQIRMVERSSMSSDAKRERIIRLRDQQDRLARAVRA